MSSASSTVRASGWWPFSKGEPLRNVALFEVTAIALGVLWHLAVVVLPGRANPFIELLGSMTLKDHLFVSALFVATSLVVSTAFRSPILRSAWRWVPALGAVLMFVGAGLFMLGFIVLTAALSGDRANWSETAIQAVVMGPLLGVVFAMRMFFITIPIGIVSVCALRWIDRLSRRTSAGTG